VKLIAAAAAFGLLAAAAPDLRGSLQTTAAQYFSHVAIIAGVTGRDTTMDYYQRLLDDADMVGAPVPTGYPADVWEPYANATAELDLSLADQLLRQSYRPMAEIRGLGETLIRSSKDGTMQPVAVYVPPGYTPGRAAPLAVFLHGRPQSESSLIAPPFIEALADASNTIVVAPYGRGYYDFHGSEGDVYDAVAAATKAFSIDPRRHYLIGYSMGGFSVFSVAPIHPDEWTAVMSIAGALLADTSHTVTAMLARTPFYILTGSLDESIPTQYPTATAVFLRDSGIPVTYYSDPKATHRLYTLRTILAQAWDDMEHGIVRTPVALRSSLPLLGAPPAGMKT
jgi:pimeloyl-ACP methyl ester carboxylesterase